MVELDRADWPAGDGMGRLGDLRGRVLDEEQALCGGVGFQQAGDHHSQGLGGGKRGRRGLGQKRTASR